MKATHSLPLQTFASGGLDPRKSSRHLFQLGAEGRPNRWAPPVLLANRHQPVRGDASPLYHNKRRCFTTFLSFCVCLISFPIFPCVCLCFAWRRHLFIFLSLRHFIFYLPVRVSLLGAASFITFYFSCRCGRRRGGYFRASLRGVRWPTPRRGSPPGSLGASPGHPTPGKGSYQGPHGLPIAWCKMAWARRPGKPSHSGKNSRLRKRYRGASLSIMCFLFIRILTSFPSFPSTFPKHFPSLSLSLSLSLKVPNSIRTIIQCEALLLQHGEVLRLMKVC